MAAAVAVAVVAETATKLRDGTGNHRATIGGPVVLFAVIQTTIFQFADFESAWSALAGVTTAPLDPNVLDQRKSAVLNGCDVTRRPHASVATRRSSFRQASRGIVWLEVRSRPTGGVEIRPSGVSRPPRHARFVAGIPVAAIIASFGKMFENETLMALEAGTKLGPYEILSPLGAGGMGEVYQA